jgi:hypothetical protein
MLDRISQIYQEDSLLRFLVTACGVLLVAAVLLLAWSVRMWRVGEVQWAALGTLPTLNVQTATLPSARLLEIASRAGALYEGVKIEATPAGDAIKVSVPSVSDYARWQQAVFGVMKAAPEAAWQVRHICAADCAAGGIIAELGAHQFQLHLR